MRDISNNPEREKEWKQKEVIFYRIDKPDHIHTYQSLLSFFIQQLISDRIWRYHYLTIWLSACLLAVFYAIIIDFVMLIPLFPLIILNWIEYIICFGSFLFFFSFPPSFFSFLCDVIYFIWEFFFFWFWTSWPSTLYTSSIACTVHIERERERHDWSSREWLTRSIYAQSSLYLFVLLHYILTLTDWHTDWQDRCFCSFLSTEFWTVITT